MRVRTQLRSFIAAALLIAVLSAALVAAAARREDDASDALRRAQTTEHEIAGLLALTQEFARDGEPRVARQWHERHAAIAAALEDDAHRPLVAGDALSRLRAVVRGLAPLFARLEQVPAGGDDVARRRKEPLLAELLAHTQAMSDDAYQWFQESVAVRGAAQRDFALAAYGAPGATVLMLVAAAIAVRRRLLRPMKALEHAAAAIQRGDLAFRLASDSRDEFGELARGFDAMTAALLENMRLRERSERRLADLIDAIPAMVGYFDMDQRCGYANEAALKLHGLQRDEIVGMTLRAALGEDLYVQHENAVKEVLRGRRTRLEGHAPFQGREAHFQAHLVPDPGADGLQRGFYIMTFDITALKEAEAQQASSERRLRAIADNLPVSITYVDDEERFRFINRTGLDWAGREASEMLGRRVEESIPADRYALRRDAIARAHAGERITLDIDAGTGRSLQCVYVPDVRSDGRVAGLYGLETDVSAMKKIERQLSLLVRCDALTGLANRYQFNDQMPRILARARRARTGLALMYLDIDRFKQINDTLGHAAGDAVLQAFAQRVLESVRATDTVARLGGDEFVVILEGLHDEKEAQVVARKILANVARPFEIAGGPLAATTSIGIAWCADVGEGAQDERCAQQLLARADEALYLAKAGGRATWRLLTDPAPSSVAEAGS